MSHVSLLIYFIYIYVRSIETYLYDFRNVMRSNARATFPARQILPDTPDVRLSSEMYLGHIRSSSFVGGINRSVFL